MNRVTRMTLRPGRDRDSASVRAASGRLARSLLLLIPAVAILVATGGCSPEAARARAGGPGTDVGNSAPPIRLHGDRSRNNPDFRTPSVGRAPSDAKGVQGWWASRER